MDNESLDEQVVFQDTYLRLNKILNAARDRDRREMEANGIYPVYLGVSYEGIASNPTHTITKWLIDGRRAEVRNRVDDGHRRD